MASQEAVYHEGVCIGFLRWSRPHQQWIVQDETGRTMGWADDRQAGHAALMERYAYAKLAKGGQR